MKEPSVIQPETPCSQCGQPMAKHRFVKHVVFTCNNLEGCSLYGERQGIREIATASPLDNSPLKGTEREP